MDADENTAANLISTVRRIEGTVDLISRSMNLPAGRQTPHSRVKAILRFHRRREEVFGSRLFSEAGWEIMLQLYNAMLDSHPMTISDAAVVTGVPQTTALRWITLLIDRKLVARSTDPADRRRSFVQLTPHGKALLDGLLEEIWL